MKLKFTGTISTGRKKVTPQEMKGAMRSIFGWSYPPGAANDPYAPWNQETPPCDVCGGNVDCDTCVCPECHVCGVSGDPLCYEYHGLVRTSEQIAGMESLEEEYHKREDECRAEAEYWADPQRAVEAAAADQYWADLEQYNRERGV